MAEPGDRGPTAGGVVPGPTSESAAGPAPTGSAAGHADPPAPTRSRAGRNLPAAIAVGGGLAALVVAALLFWRPAFLVVVVLAVGVASTELARAMHRSGARPPLPPILLGGAAIAVAGWFGGPTGLVLALLLTVLATMVWRMTRGPAGYQRDVGAAVLIVMYVPFLGGFATLLAAPDDGHWRVLTMLAVVILSDTGGYVAGVLFGRHPMAPTVSPKKSWEGLAGSLLAAAAGGAVGLWLAFSLAWWWGALVGLLVAGAAVIGDLAESLLKRDLGVKDMSTLLPGHGGLMDRLDSILFAAPTAYLLLAAVTG